MNKSLKDAFGNSCKIGAAVNRYLLEQKEVVDIIRRHFSSLTPENSMKFGPIHPKEDQFSWEECDFIADFARKNDLEMRGHTFVWHNQNPSWLFLEGNETASKSTLFKRLEEHIAAVSERYCVIVVSWDVINEAIDVNDGDEKGFRLSDWYKICGREVYEFAFKKMREVCPKAKLVYNDYNNESGPKLDASLKFLSSLLDAGVPVDRVGIQGHWYYNFPDEKTLRTAIERYSSLGLEVELTEVDISAYQWSEAREKAQFFNAIPQDRKEQQSQRYREIFAAACEYSCVKNITTWGIADNYTWLDNFPVKERKNWPLLFDEQYMEKPVVAEIIQTAEKNS